MKFVVSARKYRPKSFDEVVGQEHVTDTLNSIVKNKKLAHAFLFTGPRGVGKTTCARIFAKVINCEKQEEGKFCGSGPELCASCAADTSMNIFELDAASNNSVDHIRNLTEQVRVRPQKGKYRVFIIDEVHMLSAQAFNAFLKTLEEPPEYAIFILATTEKHKIIPTILSRCQIYDFHRISIPKTIEQLRHVAKQENIEVEEDALFLIAEKADGALRDALSLFDRLASAAEGAITYAKTVDNLFVLDHSYYFKIADAVLREDSAEILVQVDDVLKKGFQGDQLINGLSQHYRNLLLCKDAQTISLLDISDELRSRYQEQAQLFRSDDLMTAIDIANQCDIHYQRAQNKRLHVEIALLKQCFIGRVKQNHSTTVEKKKLAQSSIQDTSESKPKPEPKPKTETQKPSASHVVDTPVIEQPAKLESQTTEPAQIAQDVPEQKSALSAPVKKFVGIDALISNIKKENSQNKKEEIPPELSKVKELWSKIAQNIQSPSLNQVMTKAILEINDFELKVNVGSKVGKELIQQEKILLQELRSDLDTNMLEIKIVVNRELFPEVTEFKTVRVLSNTERYEIMEKQNPILKKFVNVLDLKPLES